MAPDQTFTDRLLNRIKNNRIAAFLAVFSVVITGIAAFADNLRRVLGLKDAFGPAIELVALNVVDNSAVIYGNSVIDAIYEFRSTVLKQTDEEIDSLGRFPLLDVTVKNNASETVALTALDFKLLNIVFGPKMPRHGCKFVAPTYYYNVLWVGTEKIGDQKRVDLHQALEPKTVDRFIVAIGWDAHVEGPPRHRALTFEFDLSLHSDEGSTHLGSRAVTIGARYCTRTQPAPLGEVTRTSRN